MKKIRLTSIVMATTLLVACEDGPRPGPADPDIQPLAGDLIGLLPGSTLAAVEILDLEARWEELRANPRLAHLQNRLLDQIGLEAADVPQLAGSYAVLALVPDDASRRIVPIVVLDPPAPADALMRLARSDQLVAVQQRGAIWTGPSSQARRVESIARGDGTSLRQAVDMAPLAERLPEGGLVRAILNPEALRQQVRHWAELARTTLTRKLSALLGTQLSAVESAGFRRDFVDGELVSDAWFGIDATKVPEAVERALARERSPARLPGDLADDVVLVWSFPTEPEAGLAWLRTLAARDPRGPLRQLDFWIDEFEARSGRDVETDIVGSLGERGLLLAFEESSAEGVEVVLVLDASDPERLEASFIDLRDWLGELVHGRSLGLATPKRRGASVESGAAHGLDFWSPFGTLSGPLFQLAHGRLVIATGQAGLERGVELARSAESWQTPEWALEGDGLPDEAGWFRSSALAGIIGAAASADHGAYFGAVEEFLTEAGEARVRVDYQEGGFRITARLRLGA